MTSTKTYVNYSEKYDRIVALIDMDAFYCQVEQVLNPELKNKPLAVVQYLENAGIIAVNYEAKAKGVTRHMREKEAKSVCSDLICVKVPSKYGKADLTKYRSAGVSVAKVFHEFTPLLERASVDEAYLDITENVNKRMKEMKENKFTLQPSHLLGTYVVGYTSIGVFINDVLSSIDQTFEDIPPEDRESYSTSKLRLLLAATIVNEIRATVKERTGYTCSAGIHHNKILAKLVCGMNKPNKQTLLPIESINEHFKTLQISKIKGMGAKTGEEVCQKLNIQFMGDLLKYSESDLQQHCGSRIGSFLYHMARGIDLEKVVPKTTNKSIAVSKNYRGKNEINNVNTLRYWLKELAKEIKERLEKDAIETNRSSKQMICQFTQVIDGKDTASSRTVQLNGNALNTYSVEEIAAEAYQIIQKNTAKFLLVEGKFLLNNNITHLGITASKFEDNNAPSRDLQNMLKNHSKKSPRRPEHEEDKPTIALQTEEKVQDVLKKSPKAEKFENKSEMLSFFKKYEAKCEKMDVKENCVASSDEFKITNTFINENAIKGLKTLRHWIQELMLKLKEKSQMLNQSPAEIQVNWKQLINEEEKAFSKQFALGSFENGSVDASIIIEKMQKLSTEFFSSGGLLNPILALEIIGMNIVIGQEFSIVLEENKSVQEESEHVSKAPVELMEVDADSDENEISYLEQSFINSNSNPVVEKVDHSEESKIEDPFPTLPEEENPPSPDKSVQDEEPGPSYKETYAEFQNTDMIDVLNPLEKCLECGKMIRKLDMLIHIDQHFAYSIAMSQREQYRLEQKKKMLNISNKKNVKKETKPKVKAPVKVETLFEKFSRKKARVESTENKQLCELCNEYIEPTEFQTHQDYHYAQKLRMENLESITKTKIKQKPAQTNSNLNKSAKNCKSLKDYF